MRATRDGGWPSSARALGATKSSKPDKHMSTSALLFPAKMAFMLFPLSSAASPEARPIGSTSVRTWSCLTLPVDITRCLQLSCSCESHIWDGSRPSGHRVLELEITGPKAVPYDSRPPRNPSLHFLVVSACAVWENACV